MNLFLHSCLLYLRRFRWEIVLLWLVSISLSVFAAAGADSGVTLRLAPLEIVFLCIVVVRFAVAEEVFVTTGGWRVRPLDGRLLFRARLGGLVIAVVPPVLVRLVGWAWLVDLPAGTVLGLLWHDGWPVVVCTGGLLFLVRLSRLLLAREAGGIALLIVGPAFALGVFLWLSHALDVESRGSGFRGTAAAPAALVGAVPGGIRFLGKVEKPVDRGVIRILTVPLAVGEHRMGSRRLRIQRVRPVGDQLELVMDFRSAVERAATRNLIFVVKYSDGSYSSGNGSESQVEGHRFWMFRAWEERRQASYESPVSLPWNHRSWSELLQGAEWVVFERGGPPIPVPTEPAGSAMHSDLAYIHAGGGMPRDIARRASAIGAEQMSEILAWPTWSNLCWMSVVEPYLSRNPWDGIQGVLESRLTGDPRLSAVFWSKGLHDPVEQELRRRLHERRPLGLSELGIAIGWKDPSLAGDLEEAFVSAGGQWLWLREQLKDHPGIIDRELVLGAWRRVRAGENYLAKKMQFAEWAASEGDVSALRYLATRREGWSGSQVLSGVQDPAGWLAENGEHMVFDPARQVFVGDR